MKILSDCRQCSQTFYGFGSIKITGLLIFHTVADSQNSGISANPTKFPPKREIPRNLPKYFQILVGKTYLILILAIRPVLFTPNVQIYLETSSLQRVNKKLAKTRNNVSGKKLELKSRRKLSNSRKF